MKMYKISTLERNLPDVNDRNWAVPADAFILRHVYLFDRNSPQEKDFIIRTYVVPIEENGGRLTTRKQCIVMGHYGGSVGGSQTRQNQVKFAYPISSATNTIDAANNKTESLIREKTSGTYRLISDTSWPINQRVLASSIPLVTRDAALLVSPLRGAPLSQQQNVNQPSARQNNTPAKPQPKPQPKPVVPQISFEEKMRNTYLLADNTIPSLVKDYPTFNGLTRDALLDDQNKMLLSAQMSKAIMDSVLFEKIMAYPKDVFSTIPFNEQAEKKIQDFKDEIASFPKFRLIRKVE